MVNALTAQGNYVTTVLKDLEIRITFISKLHNSKVRKNDKV